MVTCSPLPSKLLDHVPIPASLLALKTVCSFELSITELEMAAFSLETLVVVTSPSGRKTSAPFNVFVLVAFSKFEIFAVKFQPAPVPRVSVT